MTKAKLALIKSPFTIADVEALFQHLTGGRVETTEEAQEDRAKAEATLKRIPNVRPR